MSITVEAVAGAIFAIALLHTFAAKPIGALAHRWPRHAGLLHLLAEVEIVFGFWALVLIVVMALMNGKDAAVEYAEGRQYTEPLFVFVVMVVAASRPVLAIVRRALEMIARMAGGSVLVQVWLGLAIVPLLGSFITEPAAMTLGALILAPLVFRSDVTEWVKYAVIGVLFVNVSIGGTLTSYAAPPVLMVAGAWNWDTATMASTFGWKAAVAVAINATGATLAIQRSVGRELPQTETSQARVPIAVSAIHVGFLVAIVAFAHHPVIFLWVFLFFLGYAQAYERFQSPLILKEGLLVGFFLAGLVVLGGMQRWWLAPIVSQLSPEALFYGAIGLTAITDNAALTYLGSLIPDISDQAKYMLVAGAVTGGGLTIIANAPNPAGVALLRGGFRDESVGAGGLLLGALLPTAVAGAVFYLF